MAPALWWAAMRAILMFHYCEGQSDNTVSTGHNFWRERRAETDSNRGPYQPNALPVDQTGSRIYYTSYMCTSIITINETGTLHSRDIITSMNTNKQASLLYLFILIADNSSHDVLQRPLATQRLSVVRFPLWDVGDFNAHAPFWENECTSVTCNRLVDNIVDSSLCLLNHCRITRIPDVSTYKQLL